MKTESDLLREQIEILKKLVDTQDALIQEMRKNATQQQISIPSVWLPTECQHEYPNPWMGTVPPSCTKCGKQAAPFVTFTANS